VDTLGSAVGAAALAVTKYNDALSKLDSYDAKIYQAQTNYWKIVLDIANYNETIKTLETGPLAELQLKLANADEDIKAKERVRDAAQTAYSTAQGRTITLFDEIRALEEAQWGGLKTNINSDGAPTDIYYTTLSTAKKQLYIDNLAIDIEDLKAEIAHTQAKLDNITLYAIDDTSVTPVGEDAVAFVIAALIEDIARLEIEIADAEYQIKIYENYKTAYDAAIKALLEE
jgi:hypothetical protein